MCPNFYLWLYYQFCGEYKREPSDIDDMLDGLNCMWAIREMEKIYCGGD